MTKAKSFNHKRSRLLWGSHILNRRIYIGEIDLPMGVGEVAMSNLTPECDLRHIQAAPDHGVCVADFGQSTPKGREACCAPVSRRASMSR